MVEAIREVTKQVWPVPSTGLARQPIGRDRGRTGIRGPAIVSMTLPWWPSRAAGAGLSLPRRALTPLSTVGLPRSATFVPHILGEQGTSQKRRTAKVLSGEGFWHHAAGQNRASPESRLQTDSTARASSPEPRRPLSPASLCISTCSRPRRRVSRLPYEFVLDAWPVAPLRCDGIRPARRRR